MTARAVVGVLVAIALGAGCSVSLDDPAGRACDESHACAGGRVCRAGLCASSAAATVVDGGSDGGAPGNLYPNGGTFESGCAPLVAVDGTARASGLPHSGSGSCELCAPGPGGSLDDKGFLSAPPPGHYQARAWLRIEPGHPASHFGLLLRTVNQPDGPVFEEVQKRATDVDPAQTSGWNETVVDLDVDTPADVLNVVVYASEGTCMLVDDLSVERLP